MPFTTTPTEIPEVVVVSSQILQDERGSFAELFRLGALQSAGITHSLTQVNWSKSKQGVLRGLHYQLVPKAQAKLVTCLRGEIFDVAVDIRKDSPTYKQWVGVNLSSDNKNMLYIPHGFAHGFYTMSDEAEVVYFCDEQYAPEQEGGIVWNDPEINIEWPGSNPVIADRDAQFPLLANAMNNFTV